METIFSFLDKTGITYERFDHPAMFTCEESAKLPPMPGAATKNLFLRDRKGERHLLVSVPHGKAVDLKALKSLLAADKLSFGSPEALKEHLGVEPGSVTILGLMRDATHRVEFFIDRSLWEAEIILCHPLVNTATLALRHADLERFLSATGHEARVLDVPARIGD